MNEWMIKKKRIHLGKSVGKHSTKIAIEMVNDQVKSEDKIDLELLEKSHTRKYSNFIMI